MNLIQYRIKRSQLLSKVSAAAKHHDDIRLEKYLGQLMSLLKSDSTTRQLLSKYHRSFDDLRQIIFTLENHGASQVIKGHYVPVSSIALPKKLESILSRWNGTAFEMPLMGPYHSNLYLAYDMNHSFN